MYYKLSATTSLVLFYFVSFVYKRKIGGLIYVCNFKHGHFRLKAEPDWQTNENRSAIAISANVNTTDRRRQMTINWEKMDVSCYCLCRHRRHAAAAADRRMSGTKSAGDKQLISGHTDNITPNTIDGTRPSAYPTSPRWNWHSVVHARKWVT